MVFKKVAPFTRWQHAAVVCVELLVFTTALIIRSRRTYSASDFLPRLFSPLGKLAGRAIYFADVFLARPANLPKGLYILPSVISFFFFSFNDFSETNYLKIRWTAIFTSNENFLAVDDRSGPLFSISQGTLPWQPILCKKWQTPHFRRSGIQKRYEVTPCMGRIK